MGLSAGGGRLYAGGLIGGEIHYMLKFENFTYREFQLLIHFDLVFSYVSPILHVGLLCDPTGMWLMNWKCLLILYEILQTASDGFRSCTVIF